MEQEEIAAHLRSVSSITEALLLNDTASAKVSSASVVPQGVPRGIASDLGTRSEEVIVAAQGRRVQSTQSAVHEMFLGARAALLEVFCGEMELTLGARSLGLCVPVGVDKTFPIGDRPWDLLLPEDQARCRELEDRLDSVVVHYTPPCTKLNTIGSRPPPGHPDYEAARALVEFSIEGIERRVAKGADCSLESPYAAGTWALDRVKEFFGTRDKPEEGCYFACPDLC